MVEGGGWRGASEARCGTNSWQLGVYGFQFEGKRIVRDRIIYPSKGSSRKQSNLFANQQH
jgi:hypothetical protein